MDLIAEALSAGNGIVRLAPCWVPRSLLIPGGRLKLTQPGGGHYHFPLGFQADYYKQLRSERREWHRDKQGHKALWWVKGKERNEAWDCEVYGYAAYLYAMAGQHAETVFRNREKLFGAVGDAVGPGQWCGVTDPLDESGPHLIAEGQFGGTDDRGVPGARGNQAGCAHGDTQRFGHSAMITTARGECHSGAPSRRPAMT